MLTVDTVTVFRHGLNFARCTVACLLLQSIATPLVVVMTVTRSIIFYFISTKSIAVQRGISWIIVGFKVREGILI